MKDFRKELLDIIDEFDKRRIERDNARVEQAKRDVGSPEFRAKELAVIALETQENGRPQYVFKEYYPSPKSAKYGYKGEFVLLYLYYSESQEIKDIKMLREWFPCYIRMSASF